MPNRENLRHGDLKFRLELEIEGKLKGHKELEADKSSERSAKERSFRIARKFLKPLKNSSGDGAKAPAAGTGARAGIRIANPFKPQAVEALEKPWEGKRFPTKFHFRNLDPGKTLPREANINSQARITFVTDADNDYLRRDEEPGEFTLFQVIDGELMPARNWHTPTLFEGNVTLSLSLPPEAQVGDVVTYEAQVMDPSRLDPFVNRFTLKVKAEREAQPARPEPPAPRPDKPGEETGKDAQQDTRLAVPNPFPVWEKDWGIHDPPFDKFTAMRIKRPPGADEGSWSSTISSI